MRRVAPTLTRRPPNSAKAESFVKTLEAEAVYPMAFETFNAAPALVVLFSGVDDGVAGGGRARPRA